MLPLVLLLCYFLLAVALAACLFLPRVRACLYARAVNSWRRLANALSSSGRGLNQSMDVSMRATRGAGSGLMLFLVKWWWMLAVASVIVAIPVLLSLSLGSRNIVFFDEAERDADEKVAVLLRGEQLVPPQPLPPEVFATAEVERVRPLTKEGSRNWDALDPDFRSRLLMVFKIMKEKHGYDLALLEGYRSAQRQAQLAALGEHVTRAKANQSYHQHGLAADNAFYRDGKIVITETDPWAMQGYRLYGETAESLGLIWGGRWSFRDYGHVEYRKPGFQLPRD